MMTSFFNIIDISFILSDLHLFTVHNCQDKSDLLYAPRQSFTLSRMNQTQSHAFSVWLPHV